MGRLKPGLTGHAEMIVGTNDTAPRVGSGAIPVLATPVMISLLEEAALDAVEGLLPAGQQSLGTHLDVSHIAATPTGMKVQATAELIAVDDRKLTFRVEARDSHEIVGTGTHERVVVTRAKFEQRISAKSGS